ncbi:YkgJ family cysteine cluster protein [Dyella mobilis]|uniref:YkgJ family cysteine cluster protein n=2 Tax=Dyella mobilis TaxID=1849582 RepID=A0ABS2KCV6_9GAMM|nr:YkgJ family cysteine cluster protein [Dyella mobilis]
MMLFGALMLCHSAARQPWLMSTRPTKGKVHCASCDAVCCRLVVFLESGDDVPAHFVTQHPKGRDVMAHGEDGWCVALDRTRMCCSIYENRPAVCRRFVRGGSYCNAIRTDYAREHDRAIKMVVK